MPAMIPDEATRRRLIESVARAMLDHADELTALDQAIGDGDHGINMKRGFEAIAAAADEIAGLDFGPALQKAGMTLVMKVGGASGPLYGSGLMAMGKAATGVPARSPSSLAAAADRPSLRGEPASTTLAPILEKPSSARSSRPIASK